MAPKILQIIVGFVAVQSMLMVQAHPNLFKKLRIPPESGLSIPAIRYQIGRLPEITKGVFPPEIFNFGKKERNGMPTIEYNTRKSLETTTVNNYQPITVNTVEENIIKDVTTSDDFTEVTTEVYTTTDLWTTEDDGISNRISPELIASLAG